MFRVSLRDSLLQTILVPGVILLLAIGWIAVPSIWVSLPSPLESLTDRFMLQMESLTDRFMLQMGQVLRFARKQPTSPKRVLAETMVH